MPVARFVMSDLKAVIERMHEMLNNGLTPKPTVDQLFDGSYYKGGEPLNSDGVKESNVPKGDLFWPDASYMTEKPIEPMLTLVGDHGVYLLANVQKKGELPLCAYAKGANPEVDEGFYDVKTQLFGYDDGTVSIPLEWYEIAKKQNKRVFAINIGKRKVSLRI